MKTINKKLLLAGLLAVAALAPMEVGAFNWNLSVISSCKNIFAMAANSMVGKWVQNGCSSTVFEPIFSRNGSKVGWEKSIFDPSKKQLVVKSEFKNDSTSHLNHFSDICKSKVLNKDERLIFIKTVVEECHRVSRNSSNIWERITYPHELTSCFETLLCSHPTLDEVEYMVRNGAHTTRGIRETFHSYPLQKVFDSSVSPEVRAYLIDHAIINSLSDHGYDFGYVRLLHDAIKFGDLPSVERILKTGRVNVNECMRGGKTPLYIALKLDPKTTPDRSKIIKCLKDHGAQVTSYSPGDKLPNGMITTEYGFKPKSKAIVKE